MQKQNKNIVPAQNKLYWVYFVGFLLLLSTPAVSLPPWLSPPDWGKTVYFRVISAILLFVFIWQVLLRKRTCLSAGREKVFSVGLKNLANKKSNVFWAFWSLISLLGIYFLATIFSLDARFSFWGDPYRGGGFLNFALMLTLGIAMFLILEQRDWKKIWDFSIFTGFLVSVVALFSQFGILSSIFIPQKTQIAATLGGPNFVGLYILLLLFPTVSFGFKEKLVVKKVLYFLTALLFLYIILITISQAAYLGAAIGSLYFLFFYPKKLLALKISVLLLIILTVLGVYFVKTRPENPLNKNYLFHSMTNWNMDQSRVSSWKIALEAIKHRPILGYGPENFSIAFDKYYDFSLPGITRNPEQFSSWWDRAHNFVFDISVTAGIPALLIYLSLFAVLFFKLRKLKKDNIVAHGIQTAFIAYFIDDFFSFDTFSIYLVLFTIIGYSLALLNQKSAPSNADSPVKAFDKKSGQEDNPGPLRYFIFFLAFLITAWFIWFCNIKPLKINSQINIAQYFVKKGNCDEVFSRMEKILPRHSLLDAYLSLSYINFLKDCDAINASSKTLEYAAKGRELAKEASGKRPLYTRAWIFLGSFDTVLIEKTQKQIADEQNGAEKEKKQIFVQDLIKEANSAFERAFELSPKRQEVFIEGIKFNLVSKNYQTAKEKSRQCIELNPALPECYWFKGLSEIFLKEQERAEEDMKIAIERGVGPDSLVSLNQLAEAYSETKNYKKLSSVYQKLIAISPSQPQYHATLSFVYRELKEYKKAREEALIVLELQPEAKDEVEAFLKTLPY